MAIDVAAWYEKYGPMVIRRCRTLLRNDEEAMDAVQDVFVNLLKAEARLKDSFPSSLLYTMATNVCINRLRKTKLDRVNPDLSGMEELLASGDENYDRVEAEILVKSVLEDESEEIRGICFMYYIDGMNHREIAGALGLSVSGVWKKIETFRKRARLKLGEDRK